VNDYLVERPDDHREDPFKVKDSETRLWWWPIIGNNRLSRRTMRPSSLRGRHVAPVGRRKRRLAAIRISCRRGQRGSRTPVSQRRSPANRTCQRRQATTARRCAVIGRRPIEYPTGRGFVIAVGAPDADGRRDEVHERITIYTLSGRSDTDTGSGII